MYTTAQTHSFGLSRWENTVQTLVTSGRTVRMDVTVYYAGLGDISPSYIDIYAQQVYARPKTVKVDNQQVTTKSCRLFLKRIYNTPVATTQDLPAGPLTYWCPGSLLTSIPNSSEVGTHLAPKLAMTGKLVSARGTSCPAVDA